MHGCLCDIVRKSASFIKIIFIQGAQKYSRQKMFESKHRFTP